MDIAVIGGSGFIGSHIIDKLLEAGHKVTVYDIMTPHRPDVRYMYLDILDSLRVNIALAGAYDAIYMLAAIANVNDVFRNPVETIEVNIRAVGNVLEAARRHAVKRVIFASTVWVYEMAHQQPTAELISEEIPLSLNKLNHIYTASKLSAEMLCFSYKKLYNQDFTILRYGIPYGPRGRMGTVITTFLIKALEGKPIMIQGDGATTRNFIYVADLAAGNVAALAPQAANQIYNLEGFRPVSVKEVAEIVKGLIPETKIEYTAARPGDFSGFTASREKAKKELGWEPKIDVKEGIRQTYEWLKIHHG